VLHEQANSIIPEINAFRQPKTLRKIAGRFPETAIRFAIWFSLP
jgi:hypothetical protein